jgi:hypothetical protein
MPYERAKYTTYPPIGAPEGCQECTLAQAVVAACNTALSALRARYDERPGHVSTRDRAFWVKTATDAQLRESDPQYGALVGQYDGARDQKYYLKEHCPGGTRSYQPGEASTHLCHYEPGGDAPALPIPPEVPPAPAAGAQ